MPYRDSNQHFTHMFLLSVTVVGVKITKMVAAQKQKDEKERSAVAPHLV